MNLIQNSVVLMIFVTAMLGFPVTGEAYSGEGSKEFYKGQAYLNIHSRAGNYLRGRGYEEALAMSNAQRYEKALEHFDNALRERPSDTEEERLNSAMALTCNKLSLEYAHSGDDGRALDIALRAVDLSPHIPTLWLNLATYQMRTGDKREASYSYEKAIEIATEPALKKRLTEELVALYFDRAVSEDKDIIHEALRLLENGLYDFPDNETLLSQKAKALYTLSKWDEAIETWDYIRNLRPLNQGETTLYKEAVQRQKSILKQGEIVVERQGFVISFDPDFHETIRETVTNFLIEAKSHLCHIFGSKADTRINVFVHKATEYNQIHGNRPIAGTALLNRIDIRIDPTIDMTNLKNVIFHEFTHFQVYILSQSNHIPIWFNEGIAQYFEPKRDLKRLLSKGIQFFKKQKLLTYDEIVNIQSLPKEQFYDAYTQSYFMVKYIIDNCSEERALSLIELTGKGTPFNESFTDLTGASERTFFQEYRPLFKGQLLQMRNKLVPAYKGKESKD